MMTADAPAPPPVVPCRPLSSAPAPAPPARRHEHPSVFLPHASHRRSRRRFKRAGCYLHVAHEDEGARVVGRWDEVWQVLCVVHQQLLHLGHITALWTSSEPRSAQCLPQPIAEQRGHTDGWDGGDTLTAPSSRCSARRSWGMKSKQMSACRLSGRCTPSNGNARAA